MNIDDKLSLAQAKLVVINQSIALLQTKTPTVILKFRRMPYEAQDHICRAVRYRSWKRDKMRHHAKQAIEVLRSVGFYQACRKSQTQQLEFAL